MRTVPILNEGHRITQRGIGSPAFPKNKVTEATQMNTMESGQLDSEGRNCQNRTVQGMFWTNKRQQTRP